MKFLNSIALATLLLLCALSAQAQVTGDCVNCHTMHNSQDGQAIVEGVPGMPTLLVSDCVGCHSNVDNSNTIMMLGDSEVPIVFNPNGALQYPPNGSSNSVLAGGNFYWVQSAVGGDAYGHNVYGISDVDAALGALGAPGGSVPPTGICADCHGSLATVGSGCQGCHLAQHHADDGVDGVTGQEDGWYRFLGSAMFQSVALQGVTGVEDSKWEQNPSATAHNVYKGTTIPYGSGDSQFPVGNSIGSFCAGCHSKFHSEMEISGAWVRHPSDVVLPDDVDKEYAAYTSYDPLAPIAKDSLDGTVSGTVTAGVDLVTCVSCHRPHGSPNPDMLRWDYTNDCNAGVQDSVSNPCGCFTCHTTKDGD